MIEVTGNLWTYPADVRVITTNGSIRIDGKAVMGRGCAFEATQRFPLLQKRLGYALLCDGNHVHLVEEDLLTFPVKHEWRQTASLSLIEQSARELAIIVDYREFGGQPWNVIVLPRPGCGNGGLQWSDVRKVIAPILDDRFHVITFE